MILGPLLCATALLAAFAGSGGGGDDPSERVLRRRWERMDAEARSEAIEWFRFEVSQLDTLQMRLVRSLVAGESLDPGDWPTPPEPVYFDEEKHAGKSRSKRKLLTTKSSKVRSAIKKYVDDSELGERFPVGWDYHWGSGTIVVRGDPTTDDHVFESAVSGRPPGLDLARAICLRRLDRGEQRKIVAAFDHAYADRRGSVYGGLTLWDVWSSGKKFEVPDADALGILHEATGDWSSFRTPISTNEQRALYGRIGELFQEARRYHDLRQSLADILLLGEPAALEGYGELRVELHTLWIWSATQPAELARELPAAGDWKAYMEALPGRVQEDVEAREAARVRWGQLIADGDRVRALLAHVLDGMGDE